MKTHLKTGIRFECQGSGKCCMSRGEYGFVYLTPYDRKRMANHLGLPLRTFTKRYCDKTDGWIHLKGPDKTCRFLKDLRCSIYEGRPNQCRSWPFWPENMNAKIWSEEVAKFCPGIGKGRLYSKSEIRKLAKTDPIQ
jgi:uncharacterized protein